MKITAVWLPGCPTETDLSVPAALSPESPQIGEVACGGIQLRTKSPIIGMKNQQTRLYMAKLILYGPCLTDKL